MSGTRGHTQGQVSLSGVKAHGLFCAIREAANPTP